MRLCSELFCSFVVFKRVLYLHHLTHSLSFDSLLSLPHSLSLSLLYIYVYKPLQLYSFYLLLSNILDGGAVRNGRSLQDDDNPVADEVVRVSCFVIVKVDVVDVGDRAILTDSRVLVDDGVLDDGTFSDTDRDFSGA